MKTISLGIACYFLACGATFAERADSGKPINVKADSAFASLDTHSATVQGNVVFTRGTLIVNAEKAMLTEDPQAFRFATFWAAPGRLATLRQKRDGGDLWVEAQAERIEYDGKLDVFKLFSKAKVTQLKAGKVVHLAEGAFISYNVGKEEIAAFNTASGESKPGGGRVELTYDEAGKSATNPPVSGK